MPTATVTSKGQITVPSEVRKALGLRSGSRVHFVRTDSGAYELVPEIRSVTSLKGSIANNGSAVTLEQMDEAVLAGSAESLGDDRTRHQRRDSIYVAQDDVAQAAVATQVFESLGESNQGHVSTVVLVEIDWVLRRAYGADRTSAAGVLQGLLESSEINLEKPDAVRRALTRVASDGDFADALIRELGNSAGCAHTVTFDRAAVRSTGMRLLPT